MDALGLKERNGLLVTRVTPGSPADRAGILAGNSLDNIDGKEIVIGGDVILKIDGNSLIRPDDLLAYLERQKK